MPEIDMVEVVASCLLRRDDMQLEYSSLPDFAQSTYYEDARSLLLKLQDEYGVRRIIEEPGKITVGDIEYCHVEPLIKEK